MKKFMPTAQKKLKRGAKRIDVKPGIESGTDIFDTVSERIGQLEIGGGSGFLHMIAGNADRIESRGICLAVWAKISAMIRIDGPGGKI